MPWSEPDTVATLPRDEIAGLSGLEILRRMIAGELPAPPFARTMAIWAGEADEGRVVFHGEPRADFFNPLGTVHGGWIGAILDSAMGCAVHSLLKPRQIYTTTSMTIHYVRAVMPGQGDVRCEGIATYRGNRTASSEGKLFDAQGRLLAHGIETCKIMDVA